MKHYEKRRSVSSKMFVMMLALVLVFGCAVGGTIAWLTATSDTVTNTFTYGDINIKLFEHEYNAANNTLDKTKEVTSVNNYKIIPGVNLPKDPTVRVEAGSEACWLFVKVDVDGTFVENKVTYSVEAGTNGWTQLTDKDGNTVEGVYYRQVGAVTEDTEFNILTGKQVTVSDSLTKEDIGKITTNTQVLKFTAYAVQKEAGATAADAWAKVNTTSNTNP